MLTTESSGERKCKGKAAGATGWLVKHFNPEKLLATINASFGNHIMTIDLSQFIPSFLEKFEGLELMESSLLTLQPGDTETINSIFRAAHSNKGGAGTFGFNKVTEFTI